MEINIGQPSKDANGITSRGGKIPQGATIIAAQLKKESKFINNRGDEIDPVTKQVIKAKVRDN